MSAISSLKSSIVNLSSGLGGASASPTSGSPDSDALMQAVQQLMQNAQQMSASSGSGDDSSDDDSSDS